MSIFSHQLNSNRANNRMFYRFHHKLEHLWIFLKLHHRGHKLERLEKFHDFHDKWTRFMGIWSSKLREKWIFPLLDLLYQHSHLRIEVYQLEALELFEVILWSRCISHEGLQLLLLGNSILKCLVLLIKFHVAFKINLLFLSL